MTLSGHSVEYAVQQVGIEKQEFPYGRSGRTVIRSVAARMVAISKETAVILGPGTS